MPRRVTLVALWVVFAVASVSVGFAAAGLVGDPLTDPGTNQAADLIGPGNGPVTEDGGPATPTDTSSPQSPEPTATSTGAPGAGSSATVKGGIRTHGSYVSATCRDGLVSVAATPAFWWQVDSITRGRVKSARVRFEPSHDSNGERVEVTATCSNGTPTFDTDYHDGGGGGGGSGSSDD